MSNFKIGCSPLTSVIYAGSVNKNGLWAKERKDVTETAPMAVAQHLMQKDESIVFTHKNGKKYKLQVIEIDNE